MEIKVDSRFWKEEFGFLVYRGPNNIPIDLPEGVTDCSYMFAGMQFRLGACLRNFDTSKVQSMYGMFDGCIIPVGFTFGNRFTGESLKDLRYFLHGAQIHEDVDLEFLGNLKAPGLDYEAFSYKRFLRRKKALFSWRQKDQGLIKLELREREIPLRIDSSVSKEQISEYVLMGDSESYRDVVLKIEYGEKEYLERKLKYLLEDDDTVFNGYTNLHYEKADHNSAWWHNSLD